MADASTQTTQTTPTEPAQKKGTPRGGSGLFNLYRSFGKPGAPADATAQGGAGEGPALNKDKASAAPAQPAPAAPAGTSRAAQLLAAQAQATSEEKAEAAGLSEKPVPPLAVELKTEAAAPARDQAHQLARDLRGDAAAVTPTGPAGAAQADDKPARTSRKGAAKSRVRRAPELQHIAQQLADVRERKQLKRRVRGEDYEQVTMILDRALYLDLDKRLADMSEASDGVKISRSMFVRALVRSFLADGQRVTLQGLFTPDPRSVEELDLVEAALVERLRAQGN